MLWTDVRFALRTLRRSPGFTLVAALSLPSASGRTPRFSLLYQVAMRALPVRDASALAQLETDPYSFGWTRKDNNATVFSYPMYQELRDRNQVFAGLIARGGFPATLAWRAEAARVVVEVVSGNFFEILGWRRPPDACSRLPTTRWSCSGTPIGPNGWEATRASLTTGCC